MTAQEEVKKEGGTLAMQVRNIDTNLRYDPNISYFADEDLNKFLLWCYNLGVSDINIETNQPIIIDLGMKLRVTHELKEQEAANFANRVAQRDIIGTILSGKDYDGSYTIKSNEPLADGNMSVRFRVNISGSVTDGGGKGVQITLRTLNETPPPIKSFGLEKEILDNILPRQGAIWVTGATGSGKTTLLASIMRMILEREDTHKKIITYEAPAEFLYHKIKSKSSFISQMEIGDSGSLKTFSAGIRNALRRAPQIILLGEARDKESIQGAVVAAQTGHLLFTTTHTNGFVETIPRLLDSFSKEEQQQKCADIISSTQMCISQMLVPRKGGGRIALREFVVFNDKVKKELLKGGVSYISTNARDVLRKYGRSYSLDAFDKYDQGLIEYNVLEMIIKDRGEMDMDRRYIENNEDEEGNKLSTLEQAILIQQQTISQLQSMLLQSMSESQNLLEYMRRKNNLEMFNVSDDIDSEIDPEL
jgi:dot/icm secretion system ATPase dotB